MARINFDDDIESQEEFWVLLKLLNGNRDQALGKLLRFFRLAQRAWGIDAPMTGEELLAAKFDDMIQSGWAVPVEGGYHALGAAKHFAWYRQKVVSGRSGGVANAKKHALVREAIAIPIAKRGHTPPSPLSPSLALAPSLALSKKKEEDALSARSSPGAAPMKTAIQEFIGAYVTAYQTRYGPKTRPTVSGKVAGMVKRYVGEVPIDRATELIQVYCQMDEPWFVTKCHDFGTFLENQNKVGLALDTGEQPGKAKRRGIEELLPAALEGKI